MHVDGRPLSLLEVALVEAHLVGGNCSGMEHASTPLFRRHRECCSFHSARRQGTDVPCGCMAKTRAEAFSSSTAVPYSSLSFAPRRTSGKEMEG
jgi:hypothetical protein